MEERQRKEMQHRSGDRISAHVSLCLTKVRNIDPGSLGAEGEHGSKAGEILPLNRETSHIPSSVPFSISGEKVPRASSRVEEEEGDRTTRPDCSLRSNKATMRSIKFTKSSFPLSTERSFVRTGYSIAVREITKPSTVSPASSSRPQGIVKDRGSNTIDFVLPRNASSQQHLGPVRPLALAICCRHSDATSPAEHFYRTPTKTPNAALDPTIGSPPPGGGRLGSKSTELGQPKPTRDALRRQPPSPRSTGCWRSKL